MPVIFDNIENHLTEALNYTLDVSHKADFCVGYFNLRGWKHIAHHIESWNGGEDNCCRLLVGMQKPAQDILRDYFANENSEAIDNQTAIQIRKKLAQDFKDQLTIGTQSAIDEKGLQRLSKQIKENKVVVKLFLRHSLHAKLYLCYRNDKINPIVGI